MGLNFQLSPVRIGLTVFAIIFEVLFPLVLALIARRRLGVGWRYFGFGALIFFLFQLISRVPATIAIQAVIGPQLQASRTAQLIWLVLLSFTAGLFEEVGRYIGYRWLMKNEQKTWPKAVMYGLGHGGLESMLLVGGLTLIGLINLLVLPSIPLNTLPEAQRAQVTQQLAAVAAQPDWIALLGAWERMWTLPVHVALSVLVLQVFRRNNLRWLWLAIGAHALVNLVAVGTPVVLGLEGLNALLVPELIVTIFGAIGLWVIWRLREGPEVAEMEPAAV